MALIPHLALPFRFIGGVAAVNEQGSIADITACAEAVLRYPQGSRVERPDFGLPDQTFQEGRPDLAEVRAAVARWEPRADVLVSSNPDAIKDLAHEIFVMVGGREAANA